MQSSAHEFGMFIAAFWSADATDDALADEDDEVEEAPRAAADTSATWSL